MIGPEDEDLPGGVAAGIEDDVHDDDTDQTGLEASDADEGDEDAGDDESDEREEDHLEDDDAGADEGQAGRSDQVGGKPQSRATARVQTALAKARAAEDRAAALEQRLAQIEQRSQQSQSAEQQAAERERVALMSPDERTDYLVNKSRQEFQGALQGIQFQMQDNADRTAFDSLCARKSHFEDVRKDVEAELARMRANGGTAPRETIALYLIGKRADERASRAAPRQKRKAQERIARETAKAGNSRSDRGNQDQRRGGDEKSARAKRLENLTI